MLLRLKFQGFGGVRAKDLVPLFIRESYNVLLVHGNLLVPKEVPNFPLYQQPQLLAVKGH